MGSLAIIVSVIAVIYFIGQTEAVGNCPLPSKVYSCSPKCVQDYECSNGKICCSNSCNSKSCVDGNSGGGDRGKDKYSQSGGPGSYCNNQKCNSFEVCKQDPATKRMKCVRA